MKSTKIRQYLTVVSLAGVILSLAMPAQAASLTLPERISQVSVAGVLNTTENRATADLVAAELSNSTNLQETVDSLTDSQVAIFAAYYMPYGQPSVSTSTRATRALAISLAASATCYNYSNTVRQTNALGQTIAQVTVYGTWCSDGTSITSAPYVNSNYALGGAVGWQMVRKQPEMSGFSSSQARFLAAYDFELYLGPIGAQPLTLCSKLYGNAGGGASGSSSCVF
jgi:hypothetical protein